MSLVFFGSGISLLGRKFSLSNPFLILLALKENWFWRFKRLDSLWRNQSGMRSVWFLFTSQLEGLGGIKSVWSRPFASKEEFPPPKTLNIRTHKVHSYKPEINPAPKKNETIRSTLSIGAGGRNHLLLNPAHDAWMSAAEEHFSSRDSASKC